MICPKYIAALFLLALVMHAGTAAAQTNDAHANQKNIKIPSIGNMFRVQRGKLAHLSRSLNAKTAHRFNETAQRVQKTPLGYKVKRGTGKLGYGLLVTRGLLTKGADKLEMKLPRKLARGYHLLRHYNPLGIWGFCARKFHQDPHFLMKYGIFSVAWSYLQPPALGILGVSLPLAYSLTSSMVIPVDIGVILFRQHQLREDPDQSILGTVVGLGREFKQFNSQRRYENRLLIYSSPRP